MAVGMSMTLELVFPLVILLQAAHALVIKQEPNLDTEFYVAPTSYTRKDGKALPSTIIISRPIGFKNDAPKYNTEDDFSQGSFSIMPSHDENLRQGTIDLKPNIKFYKIECTSGRSCTSIIPARTTTPGPPEIPFTKTELKKYLAQFGLYNGFPYSDDYEFSGSPERPKENDDARYVNKHGGLDPNTNRAFGSDYYDANDFWPGSQYRPQSRPSKGQVFKFQQYESDDSIQPNDFPTRRPTSDFAIRKPIPEFPSRRPVPISDFPTQKPVIKWHKLTADFPIRIPESQWEEVQTIHPSSNDRLQRPIRPQHLSRPQELPTPFSYDDDAIHPPYGPPRPSSPPRTTLRPTPYDGVWNRYSMSTVSQLDRDTGEWVKVSSSSTNLDQGVFGMPDNVPSGNLPPAIHHTKAKLTVLGISDREPHSSFSNSNSNKPHVVKIPSSHPGSPPETIETDGGYVQSAVSVPVFINQPHRPTQAPPLSDNPKGFTQNSRWTSRQRLVRRDH